MDNNIENIVPQTRTEAYLKAAITKDTTNLPEPRTRIEMYISSLAEDYAAGGGGGGGTTVHNQLTGRSVANAHPISAITDLQSELNGRLKDAIVAGNTLTITKGDGSTVAFTGEPVQYVKNAAVNADTLTLTMQDGSTVAFTAGAPEAYIKSAAVAAGKVTLTKEDDTTVEFNEGPAAYVADAEISSNSLKLTKSDGTEVLFAGGDAPAAYLTDATLTGDQVVITKMDGTQVEFNAGPNEYLKSAEVADNKLTITKEDDSTVEFETPSDYIKDAVVADNKLTLTKKDDTTVEFETPSAYIKDAAVASGKVTLTKEDDTTVEFNEGPDNYIKDAVVEDNKLTLTKEDDTEVEFTTIVSHEDLEDRDAADSHPIAAITGLSEALAARPIAAVFTDVEDLYQQLDADDVQPSKGYIVGQSFLIKSLNVPDVWISSIESSHAWKDYESDEKFIEDLDAAGADGFHIGWYKLQRLEGDYATKQLVTTLNESAMHHYASVDDAIALNTVTGDVWMYTGATYEDTDYGITFTTDHFYRTLSHGSYPEDFSFTEVIVGGEGGATEFTIAATTTVEFGGQTYEVPDIALADFQAIGQAYDSGKPVIVKCGDAKANIAGAGFYNTNDAYVYLIYNNLLLSYNRSLAVESGLVIGGVALEGGGSGDEVVVIETDDLITVGSVKPTAAPNIPANKMIEIAVALKAKKRVVVHNSNSNSYHEVIGLHSAYDVGAGMEGFTLLVEGRIFVTYYINESTSATLWNYVETNDTGSRKFQISATTPVGDEGIMVPDLSLVQFSDVMTSFDAGHHTLIENVNYKVLGAVVAIANRGLPTGTLDVIYNNTMLVRYSRDFSAESGVSVSATMLGGGGAGGALVTVANTMSKDGTIVPDLTFANMQEICEYFVQGKTVVVKAGANYGTVTQADGFQTRVDLIYNGCWLKYTVSYGTSDVSLAAMLNLEDIKLKDYLVMDSMLLSDSHSTEVPNFDADTLKNIVADYNRGYRIQVSDLMSGAGRYEVIAASNGSSKWFIIKPNAYITVTYKLNGSSVNVTFVEAGNVVGTGITKIISMTKTAYDALSVKDPTTLYVVDTTL